MRAIHLFSTFVFVGACVSASAQTWWETIYIDATTPRVASVNTMAANPTSSPVSGYSGVVAVKVRDYVVAVQADNAMVAPSWRAGFDPIHDVTVTQFVSFSNVTVPAGHSLWIDVSVNVRRGTNAWFSPSQNARQERDMQDEEVSGWTPRFVALP